LRAFVAQVSRILQVHEFFSQFTPYSVLPSSCGRPPGPEYAQALRPRRRDSALSTPRPFALPLAFTATLRLIDEPGITVALSKCCARRHRRRGIDRKRSNQQGHCRSAAKKTLRLHFTLHPHHDLRESMRQFKFGRYEANSRQAHIKLRQTTILSWKMARFAGNTGATAVADQVGKLAQSRQIVMLDNGITSRRQQIARPPESILPALLRRPVAPSPIMLSELLGYLDIDHLPKCSRVSRLSLTRCAVGIWYASG
jgi:hypothetical protein